MSATLTLALLLASVSPPATGATVPDFSLSDTHRRSRSLADYPDAKAFVVAFLGTECPLANLYVPSLIDLHDEYASQGVQFLIINSNVQDSFVLVAAHAQERQIPFPVLKDFDHTVAESFGATRTPEVFLLDAEHIICYHGRIDDQYGLSHRRAEPTRRDLGEAINELLAEEAISVPETAIEGCLLGRARLPRVEQEVTYTKHVARIMQKHCQSCHRPGEIGPMSLLTYERARSWADMIHEVVLEERMPPWYADPRYGTFANDRRMPADEKELLLAWVEQGCPKGDEADLPAPLEFVEGWTIGEPDVVYHMPEEYEVPATGVLPYLKFTVDPGFEEDVWVQAAECRPGNRAVVHHMIVYIKEKGKPLYAFDGTASTLVGWAPGDMPARYRPGVARKVPAGSEFVFEMHYTPTGTAQSDRSSVGLIFAQEPPEREAQINILANMLLQIPPGDPHYKGEYTYTFREDVQLLSFMPHMHLRGTSAKYIATYPDGRRETLLSVPDYDFNWQSVYAFEKPLEIPKGTKLEWIATWDNSADNPRNPDPEARVIWGLQTWDEMQNGWMVYVPQQSPTKGEEE